MRRYGSEYVFGTLGVASWLYETIGLFNGYRVAPREHIPKALPA
jgi:hypothetical protein